MRWVEEAGLSQLEQSILLLKALGWVNSEIAERLEMRGGAKEVSNLLNGRIYNKVEATPDWKPYLDALGRAWGESHLHAGGLGIPKAEIDKAQLCASAYLAMTFGRFDWPGRSTDSPLTLFGQLGLNASLLAGNGDRVYSYRSFDGDPSIVCRRSHVWFKPPHNELIDALADEVWTERLDAGKSVFETPNGILRATDWSISEDALGSERLTIDVESLTYRRFLILNSKDGLSRLITKHPNLSWMREQDKPHDLRSSVLGNALSVNILAITMDGLMAIQRRSGKPGHFSSGTHQTSGAGFIQLPMDERYGNPSPYVAAVREMYEETGIKISESDVQFLGLVRDQENFECGLVGFVSLPVNSWELTVTPNFETENFMMMRFNPEDFFKFISSKGGWSTMTPLGAAGIVLSLVKAHGLDAVLRAYEPPTTT